MRIGRLDILKRLVERFDYTFLPRDRRRRRSATFKHLPDRPRRSVSTPNGVCGTRSSWRIKKTTSDRFFARNKRRSFDLVFHRWPARGGAGRP